MATDGPVVSVESGGWKVESNSAESPEALKASLEEREAEKKAAEPPKEEEKPDPSTAAKELGKRGGEATAKKKAAEAKEEKPAEEKAEPERKATEEGKPEGEKADEKPPEGEEKPEEPKKAEDEEKSRRRRDAQARVRAATMKEAEAKRKAAEAEARAQALEARIARLEQGAPPQPQGEAEPQPPQPQGEPRIEDFDDFTDYMTAVRKYDRDQVIQEIHERNQQAQFAQNVDRHLGEAVARFHEVTSPHATDFSEEVGALVTEFQLPPGQEPDGSNWLANELLFQPEVALPLMLHFTEHPEDLQRIAALRTPLEVARETARLATRLASAVTETGPGPKSENVSRAAPPPTPVQGAPYVAEADGYREGMSMDEFASWWRKTNPLKR